MADTPKHEYTLESLARQIQELYSHPARALAAAGSVDIINKVMFAVDPLPCKWCASPRVAGELLRLFPFVAANDCARWARDETALSLSRCRKCVGAYYRVRPVLSKHFLLMGKEVAAAIWSAVEVFDRQRLCTALEGALKHAKSTPGYSHTQAAGASQNAQDVVTQALAEIMLWPAHLLSPEMSNLFCECIERLLGPAAHFSALSISPGAAYLAFAKNQRVRDWAVGVLALQTNKLLPDIIEGALPMEHMLSAVDWDKESDCASLVAAAAPLSGALHFDNNAGRLVYSLFANVKSEQASRRMKTLVSFVRNCRSLNAVSFLAEAIFGPSSPIAKRGLETREAVDFVAGMMATIDRLKDSNSAAASEALANVTSTIASVLEITEMPILSFTGVLAAEPVLERMPHLSLSHPVPALRILTVTVRRALSLNVQDEVWRPILSAALACSQARSSEGDDAGARAHLQNVATALRAPLAPAAFVAHFSAIRDVSPLLFAVNLMPLVGIQLAQTVVGDDALYNGPDAHVLLVIFAALKRDVDTQLQRIHLKNPAKSIETWFAACKLVMRTTHNVWPMMLRLFISTVFTPESLSGGRHEDAAVMIVGESQTSIRTSPTSLVMAARLCFALALHALHDTGEMSVIEMAVRVLAYAHLAVSEHATLESTANVLDKIRVDASALDMLAQKVAKYIAMSPPNVSNSNEVVRALSAVVDLARIQRVSFTAATLGSMSAAFSLTGVHVQPSDAELFGRACVLYERSMGCAMLPRLSAIREANGSVLPAATKIPNAAAQMFNSPDAKISSATSNVSFSGGNSSMNSTPNAGHCSFPAEIAGMAISKALPSSVGTGITLPGQSTLRSEGVSSYDGLRPPNGLPPMPRASTSAEISRLDAFRLDGVKSQSRMSVLRAETLRAHGLPVPQTQEALRPQPSRMDQLRNVNPVPRAPSGHGLPPAITAPPAKAPRTLAGNSSFAPDVLGPSTRSAGAITQRSRAEIESSDGEQPHAPAGSSRVVKLIDSDGITPRVIAPKRMEVRMDAGRVQQEMALVTAFHQSVLSLNLASMAAGDNPSTKSGNTRAVPELFTTPEEYVEVFAPLLLMEAHAEITSALSDDPLPGLSTEEANMNYCVAGLAHVDAMCELKLHFDPNTSRRLPDHEYVALILPGKLRPHPAIVVSTAPVRAGMSGNSAVLKGSKYPMETMLRITLPSDGPRALAIQRALRLGAAIPVRRVCSLVTATRDYVALHSVAHVERGIFGMIMTPKRVPDVSRLLPAKPTLPPLFGGDRGMLLNNSQVRAVHAATARLSPLLMVQGPPGTGKTQMIEALVLAVLERDRRLRVTISPSDPGSVTGRGAGRVLVCAPSNAAVDELGRRLRRAAGGSLRIVRVGAPDAISGDMVDLTLDALAERYMSSTGDNALSELHKRLAAAEDSGDAERVASLRRIIAAAELEKDGASNSRPQGKSMAARRQALEEARMRAFDEAQVVLCTLGSSGSDLMARGCFGTLVVDEACQCVELAVLAPMLLSVRSVVLVGDPQQLPPTVLSQMATRFAYAQSMFVRVARGAPRGAVLMLDTQYRMHPELSRFPSAYFYGGRLKDGPGAGERTHRPWHLATTAPMVGIPQVLRPLCFADVSAGTESALGTRPSLMNNAEAVVVASIVLALCAAAGDSTPMAGRIAVVTPYREQRNAIRGELVRRLGGPRCVDAPYEKGSPRGPPIEVSTVDGFQGQERDIVIFSCVRTGASTGGIGFLADVRRLNVALTRARSTLVVVGRADALARASPVWRAFVEDVRQRGCMLRDAADAEVWRPLMGAPPPANILKWPSPQR